MDFSGQIVKDVKTLLNYFEYSQWTFKPNFDLVANLPIVTRDDLRNTKMVKGLYTKKTSGSTGEPVTIEKYYSDYVWYIATNIREFRWRKWDVTKTIANIILPFSSDEDKDNICNFLKVMAKNDIRIKKSYENKQFGGYISIENGDYENNDENIEFRYNMVYNSFGILQNGEEIWIKRLEDTKNYIDENFKRPSSSDKNKKIKSLGNWIGIQIQKYKKKENIMSNEEIYNVWTEFINDE